MVTTSDFPHADRIEQVGQVAEAIAKGHHADLEIESYIGLDSNGRQGRYYRRAAEILGLIVNQGNYSDLTPLGRAFSGLQTDTARIDFLARCLVDSPIFNQALRYIFDTNPDDEQLKAWFRSFYPGKIGTAGRRLSTFKAYLRDAHIVDYSGGRYRLSKYSGGVIKQTNPTILRAAGSKKAIAISAPSATPPNLSSGGVIQVDVDLQKHDRANQIHWKLIDAKASFLSAKGFTPQDKAHVDLLTVSSGDSIFYEMKSVNRDRSNLLSQLRKAVAQLSEYRFIYGKPSARLCIVTNCGVPKADQWLPGYLAKDRTIAFEWTEDFLHFQSRGDSKALMAGFAP